MDLSKTTQTPKINGRVFQEVQKEINKLLEETNLKVTKDLIPSLQVDLEKQVTNKEFNKLDELTKRVAIKEILLQTLDNTQESQQSAKEPLELKFKDFAKFMDTLTNGNNRLYIEKINADVRTLSWEGAEGFTMLLETTQLKEGVNIKGITIKNESSDETPVKNVMAVLNEYGLNQLLEVNQFVGSNFSVNLSDFAKPKGESIPSEYFGRVIKILIEQFKYRRKDITRGINGLEVHHLLGTNNQTLTIRTKRNEPKIEIQEIVLDKKGGFVLHMQELERLFKMATILSVYKIKE